MFTTRVDCARHCRAKREELAVANFLLLMLNDCISLVQILRSVGKVGSFPRAQVITESPRSREEL